MSGVTLVERLVRRVPQPVPDLPVPAEDDDVTHYFCGCSPNVAFCGTDITAEVLVPDEAETNDCSLCVLACELEPLCPRCGKE